MNNAGLRFFFASKLQREVLLFEEERHTLPVTATHILPFLIEFTASLQSKEDSADRELLTKGF